MAAPIVQTRPSLYETDWQLWVTRQEELVRAGRLAELDLANIAEELRDMGASERRELRNRLDTLVMHLLKYQFQPVLRSGSWRGTITEQRIRIRDLLRSSPSLERHLEQVFADPQTYLDAVRRAVSETGMDPGDFPSNMPYTLANVLDHDFWPGAGPHPASIGP